MSTVIGAMEAYLKLNIDDFEKNLEAAKKQVASISSGFDVLTSVGDKIAGVGTALTVGLTTPVVALGTACVKTTADFDAAMSKVSAISGATGKDLEALRDKAKEMGEKTKFSATESAEAFTYMAMAGWDTSQMLDGISGIMNLAAADGLDLATTSDIVTDALTAFGLKASDAGHFADVLAKASSSANTNVSMLGESFKYVAPVAGALGYSAEDTAVALGLMANAGIKGSQAGTALRAAISRMVKPTKDSAAVMEQYGLSLTNADGSMKSFSEVMVMLRENMGDLTEAEQAQAAATLFGQEAMSGMLSIINASDEDFNKLTDAINNADGTAEQMANTMNDNLSGQLTLLKSQLEGVAIQIGEILVPIIRNLLTHFSEWISKFSELFKQHGELIIKIAAIVAAIGPMLTIIGKTTSTIGKLGSAFSNMKALVTAANTSLAAAGTSIGAIAGPILAVVAVIGVLVAAFKTLWDTNEEFRTAMTDIWNGIVEKVQSFCQGIVDRLNSLGFDFENITEVLKAVWNGFCDFLAPVFEGVFNYLSIILSTALDVILGIVDVFIAVFKGDWQGAWDAVKGIFVTLWNGLVAWFENILDVLKGVADAVLGWFGTSWEEVWTSIKDFFVNIWNGISSFFSGVLDGIKNVATTVWNAISSFFTGIWNAISDAFTTTWNAISNAFTTVMNAIKTVATNVWDSISTFFSTIWTNIKTVFTNVFTAIQTTLETIFYAIVVVVDSVWNGIKTSITAIIEGIKTTITNVFEAIKNFLAGNTEAAKANLTAAWEAIKTTVTTVVNAIQTTISTVFEAIKSAITIILDAIKTAVTNSWNAIQSTITTVMNAIQTALTTVWNAIKTAVTNVANGIKDAAVNAFNALKTGISNAMNAAKTAAVNAGDSIKTGLSNAWNNAKTATTNAFNAVKTSIGNALSGALSTVKSKCTEILNGMKNVFSNVGSTFKSIGQNVIQGIINGVSSMVSSLYSSIKNALSGLVQKAKAALGINSPSRVFRDMVGKYIPEGIAVGIDANTGEAESSVMSMADHLKNGAAKFRDSFANLMMPESPYQLALAGADIRAGGSMMAQNNYSALNRNNNTPVVEKTEIHIEKIEVRDDHDLDMVTQGLYNKQDQNLRALGRRSL